MSRLDDPVELLLAAVNETEAPHSLRARTLARAHAAWDQAAARDRWVRIWECRPLRLAWVLATAALVAANLALPSRSSRSQLVQTCVSAQTGTNRELHDLVSLPRLDVKFAGHVADHREATPDRQRRVPSRANKENRS